MRPGTGPDGGVCRAAQAGSAWGLRPGLGPATGRAWEAPALSEFQDSEGRAEGGRSAHRPDEAAGLDGQRCCQSYKLGHFQVHEER